MLQAARYKPSTNPIRHNSIEIKPYRGNNVEVRILSPRFTPLAAALETHVLSWEFPRAKGTPRYLNASLYIVLSHPIIIYSYIRHKTPIPRVNPTVYIYRVGGGNKCGVI